MPTSKKPQNDSTLGDVARDIHRLAEDAARMHLVGEEIGALHKQLVAATDAILEAGRTASAEILASSEKSMRQLVERSADAMSTLATSGEDVAALVETAGAAFASTRAAAEALQPVTAKVDALGEKQERFATALEADSKAMAGFDGRLQEVQTSANAATEAARLAASAGERIGSSIAEHMTSINSRLVEMGTTLGDAAQAHREQNGSLSTLDERMALVTQEIDGAKSAIEALSGAVTAVTARQQRLLGIQCGGLVIVVALLIAILLR